MCLVPFICGHPFKKARVLGDCDVIYDIQVCKEDSFRLFQDRPGRDHQIQASLWSSYFSPP